MAYCSLGCGGYIDSAAGEGNAPLGQPIRGRAAAESAPADQKAIRDPNPVPQPIPITATEVDTSGDRANPWDD